MKTSKQLSLTALASLVLASSALAAVQGSITISGSVAGATAITVSAAAGSNNLDLSSSPVDLQVASVREINNTSNGYTVTLSSANAGQLKNGSSGLAYTAKYNNVAVNLTVLPTTVTNAAPSNNVVNVVKPLTISYTGAAAKTMIAGTYSDTLTFTIAAN